MNNLANMKAIFGVSLKLNNRDSKRLMDKRSNHTCIVIVWSAGTIRNGPIWCGGPHVLLYISI